MVPSTGSHVWPVRALLLSHEPGAHRQDAPGRGHIRKMSFKRNESLVEASIRYTQFPVLPSTPGSPIPCHEHPPSWAEPPSPRCKHCVPPKHMLHPPEAHAMSPKAHATSPPKPTPHPPQSPRHHRPRCERDRVPEQRHCLFCTDASSVWIQPCNAAPWKS